MTMEDVYKNIFNCSLIVEKQRKTFKMFLFLTPFVVNNNRICLQKGFAV